MIIKDCLKCCRRCVCEGVTIEYVDTKEQAADIFKKALPPQKWGAALDVLGMRTGLPVEFSSQNGCALLYMRGHGEGGVKKYRPLSPHIYLPM